MQLILIFFIAVLFSAQALPLYGEENYPNNLPFDPIPFLMEMQSGILAKQLPTIIGDTTGTDSVSIESAEQNVTPTFPVDSAVQNLKPTFPIITKAFEFLFKMVPSIIPALLNSLQQFSPTGGAAAPPLPQAVVAVTNQISPFVNEALQALTPAIPAISNTFSVIMQQLPQLISAFPAAGRDRTAFKFDPIGNEITVIPVLEKASVVANNRQHDLFYTNHGVQSPTLKSSFNYYVVNRAPYLQYVKIPFRYAIFEM